MIFLILVVQVYWLGVYTQNANESLHGMIWSQCPKAKSFGMQQVQFAVAPTIRQFELL